MKILVGGIGNIFFGDDAFGIEVVRRLSDCGVSANVCVKDFGIRGFDLASALCEEWDLVILVDSMSRGGEPGVLYVIEPDLSEGSKDAGPLWTHTGLILCMQSIWRKRWAPYPRA